MRVGKRTDFEKISLEVATDGSITPLEAFSKAVDILVDQFSVLKSTQEAEEEIEVPAEEVVEEVVETKVEAPDPKKIEVTELKSLSTRTLNVLESSKIKTVGDIVKLTEDQLNELEGMGAKGIKEIKKAVGDFGLNLKKAE